MLQTGFLGSRTPHLFCPVLYSPETKLQVICMWAVPFSDPLTCIHCVPWSIGHSRYTASMCVTNLYPALVSLLSHHFSVSLTTVAMIQSRPTSTEGDGLPGYMLNVILMPTGVLGNIHTPARVQQVWLTVSCLCRHDSSGFPFSWVF